MTKIPDDLIPLAEAAALLPSRKPGRRLNTTTLYRWVERGRVRGWKIGCVWFVSKAEILAVPTLNQPRPEVQTAAERRRRVEEAKARFKR